MNNLIIVFLFLLMPALTTGQSGHETGYPFVNNYTPAEYRAHAQNFAIISDQQGLFYFGNFAGVMQFDGESWKLIPTENGTKVSALTIDDKGKVYVGARGEIGFLESDSKGDLRFVSLINDVQASYPVFGEILQIFSLSEKIVFVSDHHLFTLKEGEITAWTAPNEILGTFLVRETVYLQLKETGLVTFEAGQIGKVAEGELFSDATIICLVLK